MVDREVSVGHMLYVMRAFLGEVFGGDVEVRLRPSYFPFVEPGFEMDMRWRGAWLELLGLRPRSPERARARAASTRSSTPASRSGSASTAS